MKLRSTKLLKAVTFSSLAALTLLVACGDDDDQQQNGTAGTAGSNSTAGKAGASTGGSSTAGSSNGGAATAGKGGMTSVAGNTTAGSGGSSVAGSGGTSVAGSGGTSVAGSGGSSVAGASGEAGNGGAAAGGGGDTSNAGAGGSGEIAGAGGMGGAPDVPTPTNLSIGKTATASTEENGHGAANAIDGDVGTRWCASDGSDGNWISVDLGASHTLTGTEIVWEKGTGTDQATATYKYKIEVSTDNVVWTPAVDQSANVSAEQTQANAFAADARYVRVTVLDITDPGWLWACALEVRVMGY